jgi:hypothetical protein
MDNRHVREAEGSMLSLTGYRMPQASLLEQVALQSAPYSSRLLKNGWEPGAGRDRVLVRQLPRGRGTATWQPPGGCRIQ